MPRESPRDDDVIARTSGSRGLGSGGPRECERSRVGPIKKPAKTKGKKKHNTTHSAMFTLDEKEYTHNRTMRTYCRRRRANRAIIEKRYYGYEKHSELIRRPPVRVTYL